MADGRVVVGVHHEYFDWGCVCHHVDTWEGAESKLAQDESGQYAGYLGYPQVLTDNRFLNNAGYFGCCSPQPYNDGSATIVGNLVTIQSYPVTDTYSRSHGFSVDQPLPVPWWPPYQSGYEFRVTSTAFTSGQYIWVDSGTHYVEEAASGFVPSYKWHSTIWINDIFGAEADVGRDNHLRVYFTF